MATMVVCVDIFPFSVYCLSSTFFELDSFIIFEKNLGYTLFYSISSLFYVLENDNFLLIDSKILQINVCRRHKINLTQFSEPFTIPKLTPSAQVSTALAAIEGGKRRS